MMRKTAIEVGAVGVLALFCVACTQQRREVEHMKRDGGHTAARPKVAKSAMVAAKADVPLRKCDYSYGFWPNGFRKEKADNSINVFAVETGHYGFSFDIADFRRARLGRIKGTGYSSAVSTDIETLKSLPRTDLKFEIEHKGNIYRAISCFGGRSRSRRNTVLLESGRFVQHFRFPGLEFQDAAGKVLVTDSTLDLVAWPSSLTFTLTAAPDVAYDAGPCPGVAGAARVLRGKAIDVPHRPELDPRKFTLEMWVNIPSRLASLNGNNWLIGKNKNEWVEGCFGVKYARGNITALMNVGGGRKNEYQVVRNKALKENEWGHLAMMYDGDTLRLYINGRPAGSKKIGKARKPGRDKLRIGGRPDGHGKAIHAVYDEVRLWNRALTAKEIMAHAKNPSKYGRNGLAWEMNFNDTPAGGAAGPNLDGAKVRLSLNGKTAATTISKWSHDESKEITLHCPMTKEELPIADLAIVAVGTKGMKYGTKYNAKLAAFVVDIPKFDRDWKTGYTDIREYDELNLTIKNKSASKQFVPVQFDSKHPANITGNVPMLCYPDGRPTGIPVQLSKNWHHGAYAKYYAIIPVDPGKTQYRLRIAYGFWGKLPSASHAQLSLWGYGGNGRWDQMAIGCWGETMCFDMDNSCTPVMITDVRMLMARNGLKGKKWSWTDAGWGGDWIAVNRGGSDKLMPTQLKTAYLAHGPCLTDVHYSGYYGKDRDFSIDAQLATLRTDDHNRVFQQFKYRFNKPITAANSYLFKQGRTGGQVTPMIAYGNRDGLIAEHKVPGGLKTKSMFKKDIVLTGPGPWWVSFPGARKTDGKNWGTGYRALIIRSFKAVHSGKEYNNPTIAFPVFQVVKKENLSNLDLYLTVPQGITKFMPGDTVDMDLEWITLPRIADDYYGPNEAFRKHLAANPKSWKTTYREAVGNNLKVSVTGGKLLNSYPVIVAATASEVKVNIKGGLGCVPIRFEGLPSNTFKLYRAEGSRKAWDQSVNGNDFWQTDYDAESNTYKMTFNLPLDGVKQSTWILAR